MVRQAYQKKTGWLRAWFRNGIAFQATGKITSFAILWAWIGLFPTSRLHP